jgi:hypothetical protein
VEEELGEGVCEDIIVVVAVGDGSIIVFADVTTAVFATVSFGSLTI